MQCCQEHVDDCDYVDLSKMCTVHKFIVSPLEIHKTIQNSNGRYMHSYMCYLIWHSSHIQFFILVTYKIYVEWQGNVGFSRIVESPFFYHPWTFQIYITFIVISMWAKLDMYTMYVFPNPVTYTIMHHLFKASMISKGKKASIAHYQLLP